MNLIFVMKVLSGALRHPPPAEVLHEGDVEKNPAGFALRDTESAAGRPRRP
jgi:hypothetical protein